MTTLMHDNTAQVSAPAPAPLHLPASAIDINHALRCFLALSQESRLLLLKTLVAHEPVGLTPSQLQAMLNIPASTLSFHLKNLEQTQLIQVERQGRQLIYRANINQVNLLSQFLLENCCNQSSGCDPSRC